jgi:two-component system phosphate regulon response regulator PhoB
MFYALQYPAAHGAASERRQGARVSNRRAQPGSAAPARSRASARYRPIRVLASVMVPSEQRASASPSGSQCTSMTSSASWPKIHLAQAARQIEVDHLGEDAGRANACNRVESQLAATTPASSASSRSAVPPAARRGRSSRPAAPTASRRPHGDTGAAGRPARGRRWPPRRRRRGGGSPPTPPRGRWAGARAPGPRLRSCPETRNGALATVMIVDDEPDIREVIRFALEEAASACSRPATPTRRASSLPSSRTWCCWTGCCRAAPDWSWPSSSSRARRRGHADHHDQRPRRGGRPGQGPRHRRRRLHHQALLPPRDGRRVNAVLRRSKPGDIADEIEIGGLVIDNVSHRVSADGQSIDIAPTEYRCCTSS